MGLMGDDWCGRYVVLYAVAWHIFFFPFIYSLCKLYSLLVCLITVPVVGLLACLILCLNKFSSFCSRKQKSLVN